MNNIALGRYLPLDSIVHRLDPRAKMLAMLVILFTIFIPAGFVGYALIAFAILSTLFLAKLDLKFLWRAIKPMIFMLVFLLIINILVIRTGRLLVNFWVIKIYSDALIQTLYIVVRLVLMIVTTTILTASTKPLELTIGIEDLLTPFKKIGLPAHEIAMMTSIALRFIPTLMEETQRIMKAQTSRGVDLVSGKLKEKIMAVLSLIVPLFISAFQRADELANAMESRGYAPGAKRTRYKQLVWKMQDTILFSCSVMIFAICMGIWLI